MNAEFTVYSVVIFFERRLFEIRVFFVGRILVFSRLVIRDSVLASRSGIIFNSGIIKKKCKNAKSVVLWVIEGELLMVYELK